MIATPEILIGPILALGSIIGVTSLTAVFWLINRHKEHRLLALEGALLELESYGREHES
jgi:hypothetical protein